MIKLQDLQTIQTCHCHRMPGKYGKVTSWHAAAFSDSAEPIPHTRPWRPRRQSGWLPDRCPWRTRLSSAPRPRPGNRDRSRLASSSRALPFKSWSLKSGEHMTFNSDMWISLIQNLANNAESDSCLQHLHIWQLSLQWKMNDETTAPPNHPNCRGHDIMTCRSIQRFSGAHPTHQALAPSAPILLILKSMFFTDTFIFSASAKAWKQRQIKAGVFIQGSTVQIVITEIRRTHDIELWHVNLSDTELSKQSRKRQLLTASTYLTTLLAMKDEWWNYRTSKPSKLVTAKGCRKHENRSIQRWALPSKPDHWNPENKYMQI